MAEAALLLMGAAKVRIPTRIVRDEKQVEENRVEISGGGKKKSYVEPHTTSTCILTRTSGRGS